MSDPASKPLLQGPCPHCRAAARLDAANAWRPFCSERCKLLDLGHWFEGRYAIGEEPAEDAQDQPPAQTLQ